jgi:hypothetical protein
MWIGDVGQSHWEEVNLREAGSTEPIYYGWHCMEGTSVFNTSQVCTPPLPPNVLPLIEYDHSQASRCAVTGGYRYRGPIKALDGMYIFADSCSSEIFFAKPDANRAWSFTTWFQGPTGYGTFSGFGEDEAGNLYVANTSSSQHRVWRFHSDAAAATHTVTPVAGAHGAIAPDTPQTVEDGGTIAFTVTADAGYVVGSVNGCDGTLDGDVFTTAPVTADCEVDAAFVLDPLELIFENGFDPN